MDFTDAFGPVPIPAPPLLLRLLLGVTFLAHLLAVQFLLGLLVVSFARAAKESLAEEQPSEGVKLLPVVFPMLINLGIPPLLFLQTLYGPVFYTSSILLGYLWFAVIPLLMTAYGCFYLARYTKSSRVVPVYLGVALATVLCVGYLFTNNMVWMLRPDTFAAAYRAGPAGGHLFPEFGQAFFRWLWILAPALVAGGAWLGADRKWAWTGLAVTLVGLIGVLSVGRNSTPWWPFVFDFLFLAGLGGILITVKDATRLRVAVVPWVVARGALIVALRDQIRSHGLDQVGYSFKEFAACSLITVTWLPLILFVVLLGAAVAIVAWMWHRGREGVVL